MERRYANAGSRRRCISADNDDNWRRRSPDRGQTHRSSNNNRGESVYLSLDGDGGDAAAAASGTPPVFRDQRAIGVIITQEQAPPTTPAPLEVEREGRARVLLPEEDIDAMNGMHLCPLYNERRMIVDYNEFHKVKQNFFYRWLVDHHYFQNIGNGKKWKRPDFITNGGRIVDVLLTPIKTQSKGWEFYAIRYKNIIFLSNIDDGTQKTSSRLSHCGSVYRQMITGGHPETERINEFEKTLAATEVAFGEHQLLLVTGSGTDADGYPVQIRAYKPKTQSHPGWIYEIQKFFGFWGGCIVRGVKTLVLGQRDDDEMLRRTEYVQTEDILNRTGFGNAEKQVCYTFANRVLDFIKAQFTEDNPLVVKLVQWNTKSMNMDNMEFHRNTRNDGFDRRSPRIDPDTASVICTTIIDPEEIQRVSNFFFPDWFVQGAFMHEHEDC